jgi:AcrR family transcriptional regulator
VAEELFIEKGIEPVTIADIATASRLTRATIYKYFANRKEIAFEICKTVISGWHERHKREVWIHPGSGYQRIEKFLTSFCDSVLRFPKETRFVAGLNHLYAKEWPSSQVLEALRQVLSEDRNCLSDASAKVSRMVHCDPISIPICCWRQSTALIPAY